MIDESLDASLREYANVEPRAGLEHRVLRHVRHPPARRSWWWAGWVLATVALVAVVALRKDRRADRKSAPPPTVALATPAPPIPAPSTIRRRTPKVRKFSPPEPLTSEERALLRFVQNQPDQAREVLSQTAQIEPLTIEPLKIEELQ